VETSVLTAHKVQTALAVHRVQLVKLVEQVPEEPEAVSGQRDSRELKDQLEKVEHQVFQELMVTQDPREARDLKDNREDQVRNSKKRIFSISCNEAMPVFNYTQ
jgi:hypothetical protein